MGTNRENRYAEAVHRGFVSDREPRRTVSVEIALAVMAVADEERAADRAEIERLRRWKAEATEVILGLQDLGKALGIPLGERITGTDAARAAERLVQSAAGAEAARDLWKERCLRACDRAESAEARLDALVADLRGLADEWERGADAWGACTREWVDLRELRAVLDKHAGTAVDADA